MMEYRKLNNGIPMPALGFGVFQIPDADQCRQAVESALSAGYRLIDTAVVYDNEKAVGEAVSNSGISRQEIFLTNVSSI